MGQGMRSGQLNLASPSSSQSLSSLELLAGKDHGAGAHAAHKSESKALFPGTGWVSTS